MNLNINSSLPMNPYAAIAAASQRSILAATATARGVGSPAYKQLANELVLTRKANQQLQQELANKANEANNFKFQYLAERNMGNAALANDRILKETLETLGTKNRAQEREINRLKAQLENAQKGNIHGNMDSDSKSTGDEKDTENKAKNEKDDEPDDKKDTGESDGNKEKEDSKLPSSPSPPQSVAQQDAAAMDLAQKQQQALALAQKQQHEAAVGAAATILAQKKASLLLEQGAAATTAARILALRQRQTSILLQQDSAASSAAASILAQRENQHGTASILAQRDLMRSTMIRNKSGCPLCLTNQHTLLNCPLLRSNGYLVTYHSLLDIYARHPSASINSSFNFHYNNNANVAAAVSPQAAAAAALQQHNPAVSATPPRATNAAAIQITPPANNGPQPPEVIDLLSDSEDEIAKEVGPSVTNNDTHNLARRLERDHTDVFADIATGEVIRYSLSYGDSVHERNSASSPEGETTEGSDDVVADAVPSFDGVNNGRGVKDKPITIDLGEKELQLQHEQEERLETEKLALEESRKEQQRQEGSKTPDADSKTGKTNDNGNEDEDKEIQIIAETGKNALSDFAHPRYDCVMKPFSKDPEAFCPNCYCYVCDVKASECEHWKLLGEDSHCFAENTISKWKHRRSRLRSKRKRPERALKEIEFFLPDAVPTKLPSKRKRKTRNFDIINTIGSDRNLRSTGLSSRNSDRNLRKRRRKVGNSSSKKR